MPKSRPLKSNSTTVQSSARKPKTGDLDNVDFDILRHLPSFFVRSVGIALNRDYDQKMSEVALARGTGKVSVLLMVGASPGIRPSVLAHYILKDRSAMGRLLDQMKRAGLIIEKISKSERRAHELYLTPKGQKLVERVRAIAIEQSDAFFSVLTEVELKQLVGIMQKLYEGHIADLP
jgi:DNA-binding MarR family transcriptional regulator